MEVIDEAGLVEARADGTKSSIQVAMEAAYENLSVPYSKDKASTREEVFEKLGAFVDGRKGMIGVTSKRQLELLSLILFMMQQEKVPTKWLQILLGKFVHVVQFRRALFSCISKSWRRLQVFHAGSSLSAGELDEWSVISFLLPLIRTDLKAGVSGVVTCSDASEYGGGICRSLGLTSLGRLARNTKGISNPWWCVSVTPIALQCYESFFLDALCGKTSSWLVDPIYVRSLTTTPQLKWWCREVVLPARGFQNSAPGGSISQMNAVCSFMT